MTEKIRSPFFIFIFFGFIASALFSAVASNGYIPILGDFLNHLTAVIQAKDALQAGQFPLRIAPLEHHGWGYAMYQFYASTPYMIAGTLYRFASPNAAFLIWKFTTWIWLVIGGVYIYRLVVWLTLSPPIALLSGAGYILSPYLFLVINSLGGFTEAMALGIIPLILYHTLRACFDQETLFSILFASLGWYLLITTHPISFIYTSFFLGLFIVLLTINKIISLEKLLIAGLIYIFGCLLAAWVLDPMLSLGNILEVHHTIIDPGKYNKATHLSSLLSIKRVGPQTIRGITPTLNPGFGWPILLSVMTCLYALFTRKLNRSPLLFRLVPTLLLMFTFLFILIWSPFSFWQWIPHVFFVGQYCWRLLGQTLWIGALLFAAALFWLGRETIDKRHVAVGVLVLGLSAGSWIPLLYRYPVKISEIAEHPFFNFSQYAYTLLPNQLPVILNQTTLYTLINKEGFLKKEGLSEIPSRMLTDYPALTLRIEGTLPPYTHGTLQLKADDTLIATHSLAAGKLFWEIPLAQRIHPQHTFFHLTLKTPESLYKTPLHTVALTGFNPENHLLPAQKIDPFCKHLEGGRITQCEINVPANINLLELPVLYYPGLMRASLNHQPLALKPILNEYLILAGAVPHPGKNIITVEFTGSVWANNVSLLAWIIWIVIFILATIFLVRMKYKKLPRRGSGVASE